MGSLRLQIRGLLEREEEEEGGVGGVINANRLDAPAAPNETITMATRPIDAYVQVLWCQISRSLLG